MLNAAAGPVQTVLISGTSVALGAAAAGKMYRLLAMCIMPNAANDTAKLISNGVDLTGTMKVSAAGITLPFNECGWIDGTNEKDLTLSASATASGWALVQTIKTSHSTVGGGPFVP